MAPSATTTTTRRGRVLHLLFPSRRAVVAVAAVEVAAFVFGVPTLVHVVLEVAAHVVLAAIQR